jgi:hypothetical protein
MHRRIVIPYIFFFVRLSSVTHPHLNPPLEGEEIFILFPFQGGDGEGDGSKYVSKL